MADNTIFVKRYTKDDNLPINLREIWRYAGYMGVPDEEAQGLKDLLNDCIEELKGCFSYKVCYRRMNLEFEGDKILSPIKTESKNLQKCLNSSKEVIIFAATIGLDIDRAIAKCQRISPAKALLLQAYGAERIEALCDKFCEDIADEVINEGLFTTSRFSPGYGDFPLDMQVDFFKLLDCNRQVGISLNESLLMTPSKSVTAIFGLGKTCNIQKSNHKCEKCSNIDCEYRTKE